MVKELGNVQNWAEMLERDFLVLQETVRLANGGGEESEGNWTGSGSGWTGSESGDERMDEGEEDREGVRLDGASGEGGGSAAAGKVDRDGDLAMAEADDLNAVDVKGKGREVLQDGALLDPTNIALPASSASSMISKEEPKT